MDYIKKLLFITFIILPFPWFYFIYRIIKRDVSKNRILIILLWFIFPWPYAIYIYLNKGETASLNNVLNTLFYVKEINVKDLTEIEYENIIGKKSSIIRKVTFLFPVKFKTESNLIYNYTGMAGVFDREKWDLNVKEYNRLSAANREIREKHQDRMQVYEQAYQTYQLAQQTRKATIANASKDQKSNAYLFTSGGTRPKKPPLNLHKLPKRPEEKDKDTEEYTIYKDKKEGKALTYNSQVDITTREIDNSDNFKKIYKIEDFNDEFNLFIDNYIQSRKYSRKNVINKFPDIKLNIDPQIEAKKIMMLNDQIYAAEKNINLQEISTLENEVLKSTKNHLTNYISEGNLSGVNEEIRLKDVIVEITKCSVKVLENSYLPFQAVEFNDGKGNKKTVFLDFNSKRSIKL